VERLLQSGGCEEQAKSCKNGINWVGKQRKNNGLENLGENTWRKVK